METDKNYFLVGLFIIVIVLAGFGFTIWLTSAGKGPKTDYIIHFSESVGGLKVGSTVKFHGIDVGNVKTITIDPEDARLSRVTIHVLASTPVKSDSTASLKFLGISGDVYIDLTSGTPKADLLTVTNGELPEIRSEKSNFNEVMDRLPQITEKAEQLLEKLNHTADQINKIFNDENIKGVNSVIKTLYKHYGDKDTEENSPAH